MHDLERCSRRTLEERLSDADLRIDPTITAATQADGRKLTVNQVMDGGTLVGFCKLDGNTTAVVDMGNVFSLLEDCNY